MAPGDSFRELDGLPSSQSRNDDNNRLEPRI